MAAGASPSFGDRDTALRTVAMYNETVRFQKSLPRKLLYNPLLLAVLMWRTIDLC